MQLDPAGARGGRARARGPRTAACARSGAAATGGCSASTATAARERAGARHAPRRRRPDAAHAAPGDGRPARALHALPRAGRAGAAASSEAPGGWTRVRLDDAGRLRSSAIRFTPGRIRASSAALLDLVGQRSLGLPCLMVARLRSLQARLLPNGIFDVLVQVALMQATYMAYRLVRGWIDDPPGRRRRVRERARPHRHRALAGPLLRARRCRSGSARRASSATSRAWIYLNAQFDGDARRARLPLPAPQQQLLLRAQHVHGLDGRSRSPATRSSRPRRRASSPSGASSTRVADFTGVAARQRDRQRAVQPLRGGPLDARRLRADDRACRSRGSSSTASTKVVLVALPAARDVRDRRDRQPLLRSTPCSAR